MATWFITGASRGIGLGFCKSLLAKGHNVIAGSRNPDGARDLWELASDFKSTFQTVKLDVSDSADLQNVAKFFAQDSRTIDVLVNNAGIMLGRDDGLESMKFEDVMKSFEVNTVAPMRVVSALLPALKRSKTPKIANISSKMGSISDNGQGGCYAYRMSKAALNMFASCLAIEYPDIVTLTLHPGWVQTQMGGEQAPVEVYDSVEGLVRVIERANKSDSGAFKNFNGESISW